MTKRGTISIVSRKHPWYSGIQCEGEGPDYRPGWIYIGRPSTFGNPFEITDTCCREQVINQYELYLRDAFEGETPLAEATQELARRVRSGEDITLVCWCAPGDCHGDVLADRIEELVAQG